MSLVIDAYADAGAAEVAERQALSRAGSTLGIIPFAALVVGFISPVTDNGSIIWKGDRAGMHSMAEP